MAQHVTSTPQQTALLGKQLGETLTGGQVIAFTGGLGAGKTTFCTGLALGLGVKDNVSSPTFAIANIYRGRIALAHFDAYRISTEEDLEAAGFYDYLDEGAVAAVEWSENVDVFLPRPLIKVDISILPDGGRNINIEGANGL